MDPSVGLKAQLAQGMMSGSPMNVATPSSPTFQQGLTAPSIPMPDKSPATNFTPTQMQAPVPQGLPGASQPQQPVVTLPVQDASQQQPGIQVPKSEAQLIIAALDHRMKSLSKIHEMAANTAFPQPEQSPTSQGV